MNRVICILTVATFFGAGCATAGNRIDTSVVSQFKEGVTTRAEVIQKLGKPTMETIGSDGKVLMIYQYANVRNHAKNFIPIVGTLNSTMDMDNQMLTIQLNDKSVVDKFVMSDSSQAINSGLLNR